jgi:hypothetical protein
MTSPTTLTARIDALAEALRDAGVDADRVATILGTAATATMHALVLGAVVEESLHPPAAGTTQSPLPVEIVERPLRAAA